jgi:hypothetical protein
VRLCDDRFEDRHGAGHSNPVATTDRRKDNTMFRKIAIAVVATAMLAAPALARNAEDAPAPAPVASKTVTANTSARYVNGHRVFVRHYRHRHTVFVRHYRHRPIVFVGHYRHHHRHWAWYRHGYRWPGGWYGHRWVGGWSGGRWYM